MGKKGDRIPSREIHAVAEELKLAVNYSSKSQLIERYKSCQLQVYENPSDPRIVDLIAQALRDKKPFSVVRIGDGEANLLSFGNNIQTPFLDSLVAKMLIQQQQDRFRPSRDSLFLLKHLMIESIYCADVVGVRGIYYMGIPDYKYSNPIDWAMRLRDKPRLVGVLRAESEMLALALKGSLEGKCIASANLYLSVVNHLDLLLNAVSGVVVLVTDQLEAVRWFGLNFPFVKIELIRLPLLSAEKYLQGRLPAFFRAFDQALARDLSGSLVLVGAGPWAEMYCTIAKQRGAVAIDIGSGFDLLSGRKTRPFHQRLKSSSDSKFLFDLAELE